MGVHKAGKQVVFNLTRDLRDRGDAVVDHRDLRRENAACRDVDEVGPY